MCEHHEVEPCWCGCESPYFADYDDGLESPPCGGLGMLNCFCGGDQCVCHNHGSSDCPGCPDCEPDDLDDWSRHDLLDDLEDNDEQQELQPQ